MKHALYCVLLFSCLTNFAYHASMVLHDDPLLQPSWYHMIDLADEVFLVHMQVDEHNTGSYRVYPFYSTISKSGYYRLASGVSGTVTIAANDITLDLSGNTITGGIVVNSGQKNITIKNGMVNATGADGILVNPGCSTISLNGVSIQNATRGINFSQVSDSIAESCSFIQNTTGLLIDSSSNLVIKNCQAIRNMNAGFSLNVSTTCALLNCQALSTGDGNTASANNSVYGFVSQNGFGNIFQSCVANSTQALSTTDFNSIIAGFALAGTEQFSRIVNSTASNAATSGNGVTIPYGIYLQGTLSALVTVTEVNPGGGGAADTGRMVSWSPDGAHLAMGGVINADDVYIYQFDRFSQGLTQIIAINPGGGGSGEVVEAVKWSPSGMYIAVAGDMAATQNNLYVYAFDRVNNTLTQVVSLAPVDGTDVLFNVSWSFDEQYLAVCGTIGGINSVYVYWFDRVRQTLTYVTSVSTTSLAEGIAWSPDGKYLAVTSDDVLLYSFNQSNRTLTLVNTQTGGGAGFFEAAWSFDSRYLAVAGNITGDDVRIYLFVPETQTLSLIVTLDPIGGGYDIIPGLSWSPNGTYLAIGGNITPPGNIVLVYLFNRADGSLTLVAQAAGTGTVECVAWSPDGQYLAATGAITSGNLSDLIIYSALSFPSNNVVKNNTVSCNSGGGGGVGISGSSIANLIIQNTAYDNPKNPRVVFTNYNCVCNVYNQLFGVAPTYLQNKEINNLILQQQDIDTTVQIIESKLSSIQRQVTSLLVFA